MDLYHPGLMKPAAAQWRMTLLSLKRGKALVALPPAGAVLLPASEELDEIGARIAGFRKLGEAHLRIDMAERLARGAHEAIAAGKPYGAEDPTIVSIGLNEESFLDLMRQAGFRPVVDAAEGAANWTFKGRPKPRPRQEGERKGRRPDQSRGEPRGNEREARPDGARPRNDRPRSDRPRDDQKTGPRKPRPQDRDRERAPERPRQIVATGKALAGLGALFGREE